MNPVQLNQLRQDLANIQRAKQDLEYSDNMCHSNGRYGILRGREIDLIGQIQALEKTS